ncbi:MAG: putative Ig domain-containing protein, partial [Myxococcales bacterium]|nr:putative Ig domain-containing protein [Myxococcales bacterium]
VPGGVNAAWLTIDPVTGVLSGTPTNAEAGPVSVTVRVEQGTLPTNYDEKTFDFVVNYAAYYTSFEGGCPAGWTLGGTWQCGVPTNVGPASAFVGSQCIATTINNNYLNSQSYGSAIATSPDIDLSSSPFPAVTWRMWVDTEGGTSDGVNLKISTDGGATYDVLTSVTPSYPLTVAGEPVWGGHQQALGWQSFQANLSAYAGQVIRLRFSFASDSSGTFPGVYVDDFLVQ